MFKIPFGNSSINVLGKILPYDATIPTSGLYAAIIAISSESIFLGIKISNSVVRLSSKDLIGDDERFFPRPFGLSGAVTTAIGAIFARISALSAGTANSEVPKKIMRIHHFRLI